MKKMTLPLLTVLAGTLLGLGSFNAQAAPVYTTVDPASTDLNSLVRKQYLAGYGASTYALGPWFGVWDDVDYSISGAKTRLWSTGVMLRPGVNDILGQVTIPVGAWYANPNPLRLEVYATSASGNATYNPANYTLLESAVADVVSGRQWLTFDFSGGSSLVDSMTYLFWLGVTESLTKVSHQAYDWLSLNNNETTGVRFNKPLWDSNVDVGESELFYSSTLSGAWFRGQAGIAIANTVVNANNAGGPSLSPLTVPEPTPLALTLLGAGLLLLQQRRTALRKS